jgi:hypothetical protein
VLDDGKVGGVDTLSSVVEEGVDETPALLVVEAPSSPLTMPVELLEPGVV